MKQILVGGFSPTHLNKYVDVKLDHFPRDRGENKKYLSCHHPNYEYHHEETSLAPKRSSKSIVVGCSSTSCLFDLPSHNHGSGKVPDPMKGN